MCEGQDEDGDFGGEDGGGGPVGDTDGEWVDVGSAELARQT